MYLHCSSCSCDKPEEDFPKSHTAPASRNGRQHKCRSCKSQYYHDNKARMTAQTRAANIKRRYDLSVEQYDQMIAVGCLTCGETEGRIVMDHCHATGAVRGALCERCNHVLGKVKDDAGLLSRLAHHVTRPHTGAQEAPDRG